MDRHLQLYCVGPAKAGTHSFAGLFQPFYRTGHEPDKEALIGQTRAFETGELSRDALLTWLRERDERLKLDVDASVYNFFVMEELAELFPKAKFVFLLRDCLSWADSVVNHFLAGRTPEWERPIWDTWLSAGRYEHGPAEALLAERDLYPLRTFLDGWSEAIRRTRDSLPADRLMWVRTHELASQIPAIAKFSGVNEGSLNGGNAHLFKAHRKLGLIGRLNGRFLEDAVEASCGDLMREFFPEKPPVAWAFSEETQRAKTVESLFAPPR